MGVNKTWAKVIGIVLLLYGIWGLFSSGNMSLNVVYLLSGLIFAWAGFGASAPTNKVNTWLGVIYALLGILGMFGVLTSLLSGSNNWVHLIVGVISLLIGWKAD